MIELRFQERVEAVVYVKTVLQFRQWKIRIDASGAITPLPLPIEWTDWQDVPCQKLDRYR